MFFPKSKVYTEGVTLRPLIRPIKPLFRPIRLKTRPIRPLIILNRPLTRPPIGPIRPLSRPIRPTINQLEH